MSASLHLTLLPFHLKVLRIEREQFDRACASILSVLFYPSR